MSYGINEWRKRLSFRTDLTQMCIHLTKPSIDEDLSKLTYSEINLKAVDNLIKILSDKQLNGSTTSSGRICGNTPAVCFQETPLSGLIQNIRYEQLRRKESVNEKIRYCGVGLAFMKPYLYRRKARPVIYDNSNVAKQYLPEDEYWRIVDFDLANDKKFTDWTHEREWRLPNNLAFEHNHIHVILYSPQSYKYFLKNCPQETLEQISGITTLAVVDL